MTSWANKVAGMPLNIGMVRLLAVIATNNPQHYFTYTPAPGEITPAMSFAAFGAWCDLSSSMRERAGSAA